MLEVSGFLLLVQVEFPRPFSYLNGMWHFPLSTNLMMMLCIALIGIFNGWRKARALQAKVPDISVRNLHRHSRAPFVAALVGLVGVVCLVVALTQVWLVWFIPPAYDSMTLLPLWIASGGTLSFLVGLFLTLYFDTCESPNIALIIPCMGVLVMIAAPYINFLIPLYPQLKNHTNSNGYSFQTTPYSCGAAASATLLHLLKIDTTEAEMGRLAGTAKRGTSPGQIIHALQVKGIPCEKAILDYEELLTYRYPAILLVEHPELGRASHSVVFIPANGTEPPRIFDPAVVAKAPFDVSAYQLPERWEGHTIRMAGAQLQSTVLTQTVNPHTPR